MQHDDLRPSIAQTTLLLLHSTFRVQAHTHVHTCSPQPQSLPHICFSSQVHSEARPWPTGITNRNETASLPSSQIRGDHIGVETSSSSAETIVSEKTKRVFWSSVALPRFLLGDCTQAPHLRDHRVGSVNAQGLFGLEKRKDGTQTLVNSGSRPSKCCDRADGNL